MTLPVALNAAGEPVLIKEYLDGGILIAKMNRPERLNALGGGLSEALNDMWFEFRDDKDLKVCIITGVGDRAFGTGADLRAFSDQAYAMGATDAGAVMAAQAAQRRRGIGGSVTSNNMRLYKPVIAAINGWCLAGSCEMAMGLDIRVIEAHALMGLPEVKRSMGAATTSRKQFFLTLLAMGREIGWTGDPLTAERALKLGYVNEVVPTGEERRAGDRDCAPDDLATRKLSHLSQGALLRQHRCPDLLCLRLRAS
jgi:E-phenylitaconyl-CoA hydratase